MFWGVKLSYNDSYTCIVEHSFAITHASAEVSTSKPCGHIEVHAKINNTDIILCHLNPAKDLLQERLDLRISEGEAICMYFKTRLKSTEAAVHLSGYLLDEPTDCQWEDEFTDDFEEEEEGETTYLPEPFRAIASTLLGDSSLTEDSDDEEYRYLVNDPEDILTQPPVVVELDGVEMAIKEEKEDTNDEELTNEEMDEDEDNDEEECDEEEEEDSAAEEDAETSNEEVKSITRKRGRRQLDEEMKSPGKKFKKANNCAVKQELDSSFTSSTSEPTKKKASSNPKSKVTVTDVKVGTGKLAKPGKKVYVHYKGRLAHNDKVFDSSEKGKPFHFHLGCGDVMKGWDIGIKGMRVGGKRHLLIPASKGYGAKGQPPTVPPHSDIWFTVKLVDVK